jgi:hypothetical protein
VPHGPPPLLEFKRRRSLHPHPLNPPVHVLWPVNSAARRHCGRCDRPPPPSSPTASRVFSAELTTPSDRG